MIFHIKIMFMRLLRIVIISAVALMACGVGHADNPERAFWHKIGIANGLTKPLPAPADSLAEDSLEVPAAAPVDTFRAVVRDYAPVPDVEFREPVFIDFTYRPFPSFVADSLSSPAPRRPAELRSVDTRWIDDALFNDSLMANLRQTYMINYPAQVRFNERMLPRAPKRFRAVVDPRDARIVMEEIPISGASRKPGAPIEIERINWIHKFDGLVQFSQAYISPNWYQGGNNNLNMIAQAIYNVKLNQAFHPDLLFDTTVGYKLSLTSAPDDSIRSYSVTEDIFQVISKAGIRAAKHWFYSLSLSFKTQLLNSYESNTRNMKAAFLSPAELNLGVGMTYDYLSPKKNFELVASLSPLSWNLKTCTNSAIDPRQFGIKQGHKTANEIGSSAEVKWKWTIASNITYSSRMFLFTDYSYAQADWENTLSFAINRFLSTQIYAHLRYDSSMPKMAGTRWHEWQFKEILSFGFNYKFSTV